MNILVTCCGRKLYLVDELRAALASLAPGERHRVFVTEADPCSPSLVHADAGFLVPRINDPGYVDHIAKLCRDHCVDLLLPTKDTELLKFAQARECLAPTRVILAETATIAVCDDKLRFARELAGEFLLPRTYSASDVRSQAPDFPVVVKERGVGVETSGFTVCRDEPDLASALTKFVDPIAQQFIVGVEYTVDCLFRADSTPVVVIPRKRLRTRHFVSDVGQTVHDEPMIRDTERLGRRLRLVGPNNVQWIKTEAAERYLLEVNPRISGGLQIALAACPDYLRAAIASALGHPVEPLVFEHPILCMKYDAVVWRKGEP